MLDKIHLNGKEPARSGFLECVPRSSIARLPDGQYREAYRLSFGPKEHLIVKGRPRFGHVSPLSVEVNPSQWRCWKDVLGAISSVADPESLVIDRIDHAADVGIPIQKVRECVRVRLKQSSKSYKESESFNRGRLTGMYFGEKPEVICIYDKAYQLEGRKLKPLSGSEVGVRTRFEVRQYRKKVAFQRLSEIKKYLELNPFESIQCNELRTGFYDKSYYRLKEEIQASGLQIARYRLNDGSNFSRTYERYLEERDMAGQLHEIYRGKLRNFLMI